MVFVSDCSGRSKYRTKEQKAYHTPKDRVGFSVKWLEKLHKNKINKMSFKDKTRVKKHHTEAFRAITIAEIKVPIDKKNKKIKNKTVRILFDTGSTRGIVRSKFVKASQYEKGSNNEE